LRADSGAGRTFGQERVCKHLRDGHPVIQGSSFDSEDDLLVSQRWGGPERAEQPIPAGHADAEIRVGIGSIDRVVQAMNAPEQVETLLGATHEMAGEVDREPKISRNAAAGSV
jgi:hypothetical protein